MHIFIAIYGIYDRVGDREQRRWKGCTWHHLRPRCLFFSSPYTNQCFITSPFAKRVSLFLPMSPAKKLRWNTLQISLYRLFFSCHDEPELKMAFFSILSRQNAWTIIYGPCIFTVVRASLIGPCFSLVKMHGPTLILNWSVRD